VIFLATIRTNSPHFVLPSRNHGEIFNRTRILSSFWCPSVYLSGERIPERSPDNLKHYDGIEVMTRMTLGLLPSAEATRCSTHVDPKKVS